MNSQITREVDALTAAVRPPTPGAVSLADHPGLPAPVRRYLESAGVDGRRPASRVRMRHGGTFRTSLDGKWLPITGELYVTADPPGRLWTGTIQPFPLMRVRGRDVYHLGRAHLQIKLLSLLRVDEAQGPEMDASALVTILAELPTIPSALLPSERLAWQPLDSLSARATLRDGEIAVSGTFHFGADGRILRFETGDRFREVDGTPVRTPWIAYYREYGTAEGLRVPLEVEAAWRLDGGEASYARFLMSRVEYDRPGRF